jgi:AcrR family transcriptional regulator
MQQEKLRRSNRDRTEATRGVLLEAARRLFTDRGYADTSTPDIVAAAGVTRGALYHHFEDKQALFRAVVEAEAAAVAAEIDAAAPSGLPAMQALAAGAAAFMDAMRKPGRTRLLLLDGPAVLGRAGMDEVDRTRGGGATLVAGLSAAMQAGDLRPLPVEPLAALLSAAFDRAALAVEAGMDEAQCREVLDALVDGLAT